MEGAKDTKNLIRVVLLTAITIMLAFICYVEINKISTANCSENDKIGRYQFYQANDVNIAILDTVTGTVWTKYIRSDGGNSSWTKEEIK
ncbi:hypothetical protein PV797_15860 [Clostridiaceae bacterium M8S5]|nr:hypothetical protein PV797_15860 [Clostridiaceae bacterium M8S5]